MLSMYEMVGVKQNCNEYIILVSAQTSNRNRLASTSISKWKYYSLARDRDEDVGQNTRKLFTLIQISSGTYNRK